MKMHPRLTPRRLAAVSCLVTALALAAPNGARARSEAAFRPPRPTAATQVVVVSAAAGGVASATLTAYRWTPRGWTVALGPWPAYIGRNGFTTTPHEADDFTPAGQYRFTTLFGHNPNPGSAMPYRRTTDDDHWVDDPTSPSYNTWQSGPPAGRWQSAEELSAYPYAAAIDFNQKPVVRGANSAIFLHGGEAPTPGCIVVDEARLLSVLRWLTPAAHPVIVLGVDAALPAHVAAARTQATRLRVASGGRSVVLALAVVVLAVVLSRVTTVGRGRRS